MATDLTVANTILEQLGGTRFKVITGSSNFTGSSNSLSLKLARNKSKATHLTITLDPNNTYKVSFVRCWNREIKVVIEHEGIYCDQLQEIFTEATGLYTRL